MKSYLTLFSLVFLLISCGSNNNKSTAKKSGENLLVEEEKSNSKNLYGIYIIKEFEGKNISEYNLIGKTPFIVFDEERKSYSTSIACNQISGNYVESDSTIAFKMGASTLMVCKDTVESKYLKALKKINSYKKLGSTLELFVDNEAMIKCVSANK